MDNNRPEGLLREFVGRLQGVFGGVTGDAGLETRGQVKQAAGQVQHAYGEVLDVVERVASSRPLLIAVAAAGVGFVLGLLVARR